MGLIEHPYSYLLLSVDFLRETSGIPEPSGYEQRVSLFLGFGRGVWESLTYGGYIWVYNVEDEAVLEIYLDLSSRLLPH
jgi:hypothetical protein